MVDSEAKKQIEDKTTSDQNVSHNPSLICMVLLCVMYSVTFCDRYAFAGVLDTVMSCYSISHTEAGLIHFAFCCPFLFVSVFWVYYGHRFDLRMVSLWSAIAWSMMSLFGSFIPCGLFVLFIFFRIFVGLGVSCYSVAMQPLLANFRCCQKRINIVTLLYSSLWAGRSLAYIIGHIMNEATGDWTWVQKISPCICIPCTIMIFVFDRLLIQTDVVEPKTEVLPSRPVSVRSDLLYLWNIRTYRYSIIAYTAFVFNATGVYWWFPSFMYAGEAFRLSDPSWIPNTSVLFGILSLFGGNLGLAMGNWAFLSLRKRHAKAEPLLCAGSIVICLIFIIVFTSTAEYYGLLTWMLIFVYLVLLLSVPGTFVHILTGVVEPKKRSVAGAVQVGLPYMTGFGLSPFVWGAIIDITAVNDSESYQRGKFEGHQNAFYSGGLALAITFVFLIITSRYIEEDKENCRLLIKGKIPIIVHSKDKKEVDVYISDPNEHLCERDYRESSLQNNSNNKNSPTKNDFRF